MQAAAAIKKTNAVRPEFTAPRLRDPLATRWTEHMKPWIELPAALPDPQRARLTAARLMADGAWLACATGVFPPDQRDRERIRAIAYDLLKD
ncbi:hypothetical protein [Pengzhenrongella sp.]|jgi:hypothetical protein|uniref:hypothetical protein n=1 Tax=Pengzhenrongella sp. TaxID=2888820 RepID=UPI002F92E919